MRKIETIWISYSQDTNPRLRPSRTFRGISLSPASWPEDALPTRRSRSCGRDSARDSRSSYRGRSDRGGHGRGQRGHGLGRGRRVGGPARTASASLPGSFGGRDRVRGTRPGNHDLDPGEGRDPQSRDLGDLCVAECRGEAAICPRGSGDHVAVAAVTGSPGRAAADDGGAGEAGSPALPFRGRGKSF